MVEHTNTYSLPFPEGGDQVAVHSDIAELAKAADTRISNHVTQQAHRITVAEGQIASLNGEVETLLPREEAWQYGIRGLKGDKGDKGDRGKQGIPGVDSVPADEAVAAYLDGDATHTRQVADSLYPSQSDFQDVKNLAENAPQRSGDETIEGDWTFSRGRTPSNPVRVGVHRSFDSSAGDLFTSDVWLGLSIDRQSSTSQNPPGYNVASLVLVEDGEHGEQYQGESARIQLISNRILFNKRLEIKMGDGNGRASLSSGSHPGYQFARLSLHNASHPRLDLYGPNNESHNGTRKNLMVLDGARLDIRSGGTTPQRWEGEDSEGVEQRLEVGQFGQGHQAIRGFYDGEEVGGIRWDPRDMSVRIDAANRILLQQHVVVEEDIEYRSGRGPVVKAPNGQQFRIRVNDDGALTTTEVS